MKRPFLLASLTALLILGAASAHAQAGYGQPGGFPGGGFPGGPGGFGGPPPQQQSQGQTLPEGIDKIYAMEGPNALLLFGTQQGYETTMEIVKALDGDLELTRTDITYARATPDYLATLGVTVGPDGALSAGDVQRLVDARSAGKFAGTDTLRITSREEYITGGQIGSDPATLSLTEQTDVDTDGRLRVTLLQPIHTTVTLGPGQKSVVALPPRGTDLPISLLFISASVLPG